MTYARQWIRYYLGQAGTKYCPQCLLPKSMSCKLRGRCDVRYSLHSLGVQYRRHAYNLKGLFYLRGNKGLQLGSLVTVTLFDIH